MELFLGPLGTLLLALLAVGLLIGWPLRNRHLRQRAARAAAASRLGMAYVPPGHVTAASGVDEGAHLYSGRESDIAWTLECYLLAETASADGNTPGVTRSYSRWCSDVEAAGFRGGYLLLMNLPDGASRPKVKPGPLDALLDQMAALALRLYARSYFGETRADALPLLPQHRCSLGDETLDGLYTAFADRPERLARVNDATRAWLRERHSMKMAVLWDGHGLAVSWPGGKSGPEEVAALAREACQLARLRETA